MSTRNFYYDKTELYDQTVKIDLPGPVLSDLDDISERINDLPNQYLSTSGGSITGSITTEAIPTNDNELVNKRYVDSKLNELIGSSIPPGSMIRIAGTPPPGFLICNGASVKKVDYPTLFSIVGTRYGTPTKFIRVTEPTPAVIGNGQPWCQQDYLSTMTAEDYANLVWIDSGINLHPIQHSEFLVTNKRIIAIGGINYSSDNAVTNAVRSAEINHNTFEIGNFVTSGQQFVRNIVGHKVILTSYGGIVIGGRTESGAIPNMTYFTINADGSISDFFNLHQLPTPVQSPSVVLTCKYPYVIGGYNEGFLDTIYRGTYFASGMMGNWSQVGTLPKGYACLDAHVIGARVYLVGGFRTDINGVFEFIDVPLEATINNDGVLGEFTVNTNNIPSPNSGRAQSMSYSSTNSIMTAGGSVASGNTYILGSNTIRAGNVINKTLNRPDGFNVIPGKTLPFDTYRSSFVTIGNRLYAMVNKDPSTDRLLNIHYAVLPIDKTTPVSNYEQFYNATINNFSGYPLFPRNYNVEFMSEEYFKLPDMTSQSNPANYEYVYIKC